MWLFNVRYDQTLFYNIACLGYAGLTTNTMDILLFLKKYKQIQEIVVLHQRNVKILSRHQLITDDTIIQRFNCRVGPEKRSWSYLYSFYLVLPYLILFYCYIAIHLIYLLSLYWLLILLSVHFLTHSSHHIFNKDISPLFSSKYSRWVSRITIGKVAWYQSSCFQLL